MPEKVPKRVDRMSHIYTVRKKKNSQSHFGFKIMRINSKRVRITGLLGGWW